MKCVDVYIAAFQAFLYAFHAVSFPVQHRNLPAVHSFTQEQVNLAANICDFLVKILVAADQGFGTVPHAGLIQLRDDQQPLFLQRFLQCWIGGDQLVSCLVDLKGIAVGYL